MRSPYSEVTCDDIPPSAVYFILFKVVFCMPFRKLLSSILLRSVGIIFRYSSSVTIVESMRIVSMIYDLLLTATGEFPALRRAFERSLLSYVISSVVNEASILEMASIVC